MSPTPKSHKKYWNNPFSRYTFSYIIPLVKQSLYNELTEDDLYDILDEDNSKILGDQMEKLISTETKKHKNMTLMRTIWKMYWRKYIITALIQIIVESLFIFLMPNAIKVFVLYLNNDENALSQKEVMLYAGLLFVFLIIRTLALHNCFMILNHIAMKIRVGCSALIYRKTLRLKLSSFRHTSVGQLVTVLANDLAKFDNGLHLSHYLYVAPIQAIIGTWLIYKEIGYFGILGVACLLILVLLIAFLSKKMSSIRLKISDATDNRLRIISNLLSGIQVVKMYCWEKLFELLVKDIRKKELYYIKKRTVLFGIIKLSEVFVVRLCIFLSITGYALEINKVSASKIFSIVTIFNILGIPLIILYFVSLNSIVEIYRAIHKIQTFLLLDDCIIDDEINESKQTSVETIPKIELQNVQAKWASDSSNAVLNNINLSISQPTLTVVIGPVGCGKSNLLKVLIKELIATSGNLNLQGKISYASQQPFLFSGSIKDNILFGQAYNKSRYQEVIKACALDRDFESFPYKDATLLGERGQNLSGGQKSRVNLARCVYAEADIYLLDDPLSAVDNNVGRHLYANCIKQFLRNKIRVLVTHQLQYINDADEIVIMEDGTIQERGSFVELQQNKLRFSELLRKFHQENRKDKNIHQSKEINMETKQYGNRSSTASKEYINSNTVSFKTYVNFITSGNSSFMFASVILTFIISFTLAYGSDYFVAYWTKLEEYSNFTASSYERICAIYFYAGLILGNLGFSFIYYSTFIYFLNRITNNLHKNTMQKLLKSPISFFDKTPMGQIINRFSKDTGTVDEILPIIIFDVVKSFSLFVNVMVLSIVLDYFLAIPIVVLLVLFYSMRKVYAQISQYVKRLESNAKSPVFNHLITTINGLTTIRVAKAESRLIRQFDELQDMHSKSWFVFLSTTRCFMAWLEVLTGIFISIAVIVMLNTKEELGGADLGMIVAQYMAFASAIPWGLNQWTQLENQMVSVERILEYHSLPEEANKIMNLNDELLDWPKAGNITFNNVNLRYKPTEDYVLKNITFEVKSKEKIGIVGRTGAGKSSIVLSLFQLYNFEGVISVDETDISTLPLEFIRSKISIIPQEPILFVNTIQKNLDPFDEFKDYLLWEALEHVQLKEYVSNLKDGLNTFVSEGESIFSLGQRQLLCLARALLRKNKILVLDEATANVDAYTDEVIQQTIKVNFSHCTVIIIAHRLHTIMGCNRLLVMDNGEIKEYDNPCTLIRKENSYFQKLAMASGESLSTFEEKVHKFSSVNLD